MRFWSLLLVPFTNWLVIIIVIVIFSVPSYNCHGKTFSIWSLDGHIGEQNSCLDKVCLKLDLELIK